MTPYPGTDHARAVLGLIDDYGPDWLNRPPARLAAMVWLRELEEAALLAEEYDVAGAFLAFRRALIGAPASDPTADKAQLAALGAASQRGDQGR